MSFCHVSTPPLSPSPTNESGPTPTTIGSETSSDHGSFVVPSAFYIRSSCGDLTGPFYENMEFHKVNLNQNSKRARDGLPGIRIQRFSLV